jgi:hypothetical protein
MGGKSGESVLPRRHPGRDPGSRFLLRLFPLFVIVPKKKKLDPGSRPG